MAEFTSSVGRACSDSTGGLATNLKSNILSLPEESQREIAMFVCVKDVLALLCCNKLLNSQCELFCEDQRRVVHGWSHKAPGLTHIQHLHVLETSSTILSWSHNNSAVTTGKDIIPIQIGAIHRPSYRSFGQVPPSVGNSFEGPEMLMRKGEYTFSVRGGINPHHGISTFSLVHMQQDTLIGSVDWYSRQTQNGVTFTLLVSIPRTQLISIKCCTTAKNTDSLNYWLAFSDFTLQSIVV